MIHWLRKHWLLILILIIALSCRLYRISDTMTFLEDEGRDLLIVKRMIDTGRPVLLGPQTSTGNMYLGPLYYYVITPALFLAHMNPVGPAILIALSGVLTTYLLCVLGKKWFSPTAGYLAAILFAALPFSVMVTRTSWNPNLVPLITVALLLVYDRLVYHQQSMKVWLLYGVCIGILVQLHYLALIYCGVLSLAIAWNKRHELGLLCKGIAGAVLGLLIMLLPFIVFEYRNHWVNTHAITRFMQAREERNIRYDLPAWLWWDKVSKTSYRLIGNTLVGSEMGPQPLTKVVVFGFVFIFIATLWVALRKKDQIYGNLALLLLGSLAVLGIYQENIHMHYLEFGIPLIILASVGAMQARYPKWLKLMGGIFLIFVALLGTSRTYTYINSGATHQAEKAELVAKYIVKKAGTEPYNVVSTQGMYTTPFQYYLAISGHPPTNTLTLHIFDICAGAPCPLDDETTTLLFLTGPGHPAIAHYLGHPELNQFSGARTMISNEHVSLGIWVAEIMLK